MKYTQNDVDLYTDAISALSIAISRYDATASADWDGISDSLRPCHYAGPNN
jgi:hypothetical protein